MTDEDDLDIDKPLIHRPGVSELLARHGGLSYLEIPAIDVRVSAKFYERVLHWLVARATPTIRDLRTRAGTSSADGSPTA